MALFLKQTLHPHIHVLPLLPWGNDGFCHELLWKSDKMLRISSLYWANNPSRRRTTKATIRVECWQWFVKLECTLLCLIRSFFCLFQRTCYLAVNPQKEVSKRPQPYLKDFMNCYKRNFTIRFSVVFTDVINSRYCENLQESLEGERMQYVLPDGSMLEVKCHIGDLLINICCKILNPTLWTKYSNTRNPLINIFFSTPI